jgi:hypothetical protein
MRAGPPRLYGHAMTHTKHKAAPSPIVELADRHSNDFDVALFWGRRTGRLWVEVTHRGSGQTSVIAATPANALDVFHHPFAYAEEDALDAPHARTIA